MKRILLVSCFLLVALCLFSQSKRGLKGSLNTDKFPTISFVWNSANPEKIDKSQFVLTEDNKDMDFNLEVSDGTGGYSKSILFLWEDMASHRTDKYDQSAFTRDLLKNFFLEANLNSNDRFNVAVFNRRYNEQDILTLLSPEFTSNREALINAVAGYNASTERFGNSQESDLYSAIVGAIRLLKKETTDYQVIIVITAGKNFIAPGTTSEMESVRREAIDADISIYAIKFPIGGDTPNLDVLCGATNGYTKLYKSYEQSLVDLNAMYQELDARCYGHDYKFTFTTGVEQDGSAHQIGFSVGRGQQENLTFTAPAAPERTFGMWIKDNLILFISLIVAFVVIVVVVVILVRKRMEKRNKEIAENKAMLENRIKESNQNLENLKQQHEQERNAKLADEQRKREEEEYAKLVNIMQIKNLYPRLQCNVSDSMFTYSISKPVTKIGRNEANDVVLANMTVSGFHGEIIFDGSSFVLHNRSNSYKQGIIVNGQFFQQCTLKNGDIIGFGEAVVTFYL